MKTTHSFTPTENLSILTSIVAKFQFIATAPVGEKKYRPADKYDNYTSHHSFCLHRGRIAFTTIQLRVYYIINNINSLDSIYSIIAQ